MSTNTEKRYVFTERYLSNGIGESFREWETNNALVGSRVFIFSPTGTGKTHFIFKEFFAYVSEKKKTIIYLVNRTALKEQLLYDAEKKYGLEIGEHNLTEIQPNDYFYYPSEERERLAKKNVSQNRIIKYVKHPTNEGKLYIINYQSFFSHLTACKNGYITNDFHYVVFDECHFFLEDAMFNPMINNLIRDIFETFYKKTYVFMSATLKDISSILDWYSRKDYMQIMQGFVNNHTFVYTNEYKHSKYDLFFYNKFDDLFLQIEKSDTNEKWLIFTSSKSEGQRLADKISLKTSRTVSFISAESKKSSVWKEIVDKSRFEDDILIATKALDNGVNIEDDSVKNVVLPFCYQIEFLQMLGRKRVNEKEPVNIYIKQPTFQYVKTHLTKLKKQRRTIDKVNILREQYFSYYTPNKPDIYSRLIKTLQELWNAKENYINNLFYIDNQGLLKPNNFATLKIDLLIDFYEDILSNEGTPGYIYSKKVKDWLGFSKNKIFRFASSANYESLFDFLEKYIGMEICENEQEEFYKAFIDLYKAACCDEFASEPQKLKEALSVRKEKVRRKSTINKCLAFLELPIKLVKKNNVWKIQKQMDY